MIMILRIPALTQLYYNLLIQELFGLADCVTRSEDNEVIVEVYDEAQVCIEVLKICEHYQLISDELF